MKPSAVSQCAACQWTCRNCRRAGIWRQQCRRPARPRRGCPCASTERATVRLRLRRRSRPGRRRPLPRPSFPGPPPPGAAATTEPVSLALLLSVVADKTGYPVDMLNGGMDLETDLGIDSIKKVEIFAAVRERAEGLPSTDSPEMEL